MLPPDLAAALDWPTLARQNGSFVARFVPNFDVWVIDLAEWSDAQLRALGLARAPTVTLWLLRDGRDPDRLAASFIAWGMDLRAVSSTPEGEMVVRYFEELLSPLTWDEFHAKILTINPEAEEVAMSFTQEWLEQGRAGTRAVDREDPARRDHRRRVR